MNNLCADIGYHSLKKHGEELCGDHIEVVSSPNDSNSTIVVLADGMGSGVKASILSTLTAKIISTMMASGLEIEDFLPTIASTLPVCSVREVAYSTFTIIEIINNERAKIIEYDNPHVMFFRNNKPLEIPSTATEIDGKLIYSSEIDIKEGDKFVAISDGALYAGLGRTCNLAWQRKDVIDFMEVQCLQGFNAGTLSSILIDKCNELYAGKPGDDTTVCTIAIKKRQQLNLLIGPPTNRHDDNRVLSLFFAKGGSHVVCGGTTSKIVGEYLGEPVIPKLDYPSPDLPPIAEIKGVDLVTEGIVTISKVLAYAQDYLDENRCYTQWAYGKDGASLLARQLFESATDIHFFVGKAVNPAHQNPALPINFNIKMQLVDQLVECLEKMGKEVKVSYF